jgi:hypothetical protein
MNISNEEVDDMIVSLQIDMHDNINSIEFNNCTFKKYSLEPIKVSSVNSLIFTRCDFSEYVFNFLIYMLSKHKLIRLSLYGFKYNEKWLDVFLTAIRSSNLKEFNYTNYYFSYPIPKLESNLPLTLEKLFMFYNENYFSSILSHATKGVLKHLELSTFSLTSLDVNNLTHLLPSTKLESIYLSFDDIYIALFDIMSTMSTLKKIIFRIKKEPLIEKHMEQICKKFIFHENLNLNFLFNDGFTIHILYKKNGYSYKDQLKYQYACSKQKLFFSF